MKKNDNIHFTWLKVFNDIQFGIRSADINEEVNLLSSEGSGGASDYKKKKVGSHWFNIMWYKWQWHCHPQGKQRALKWDDAVEFNLHSPKHSWRASVVKRNIKHDQEACRRREAATLERPRNPFSIFHNYTSLLLWSFKKNTHSARSDTQSDTWYGHLQRTLLIIERYKKPQSAELFLLFSDVFAASLWDQKDVQSYHHHIKLDLHEKKKESSAPGGSFSGGTERLLSMKITWSGFKWIQIDNNERSCRMETHKCHFTEEFLFDSGCPLRLGSIIQHSAFFKPQNKPFKAFQRSSISSWTDPWTPRITGLFFSFLRLKMKEGAPGLLLKPRDDSIHIKRKLLFLCSVDPRKRMNLQNTDKQSDT